MAKNEKKTQKNPMALLPIFAFLFLYLGLGLIFEYILHIEMGFYKIPIVVIFMIALLIACIQNHKLTLDEKLIIMAKGIGDKNIVTMILIFLVAGIFVGVIGRNSAEAVAYFLLSVTPSRFSVAVLFLAACLVSTAMGTSVGTITLIVPIATAVSKVSGFSLPLCIGAVMGGSMFGDNLSFISDTTIAACSSQGCEMKDKFRANIKIALPSAIITLIIILAKSFYVKSNPIEIPQYNLLLLIPYILVLIGGICGLNVFTVLLTGILSGTFITLISGTTKFVDILNNMGLGTCQMFETIMVTILVSAMCALIREFGGFDALLSFIRHVFKGKIGGRLGVGLLVGTMDLATANNTIAIVMAGPIAKEISHEYDISPKESASLLDTFSCVFQGIIPYGAQMLIAVSTASELGNNISAFQIIPCLHYPFLLAASSIIFIIVGAKRNGKN